MTVKDSGGEREETESDATPKMLPVFASRDKAVQFKEGSSRWFLGGRAIDSYEYREQTVQGKAVWYVLFKH